MRQVTITSDGTPQNTFVRDAETGEEIRHLTGADVFVTWSARNSRRGVTVKLTGYDLDDRGKIVRDEAGEPVTHGEDAVLAGPSEFTGYLIEE